MIVIDVGCATHGSADSIAALIEEFHPRLLYGFDPAVGGDWADERDDTLIILIPTVAWTYNGTVGFDSKAQLGTVSDTGVQTPCLDLTEFVLAQPEEPTVVKIDAEGSEYALLPHLRATDADLRIERMLVEWHCEVCGIGGNGRHREGCLADKDAWQERRERTERLVRCPIEEWNL